MLHLCKTASIEGVMQVRGLRASEVSRAAGNALFSCISAEPINRAPQRSAITVPARLPCLHHECAIIQVHQSRTDEMETTCGVKTEQNPNASIPRRNAASACVACRSRGRQPAGLLALLMFVDVHPPRVSK